MLRRTNRIRSVYSSLAIEQNTLSLEQVTAVLNGNTLLRVSERNEMIVFYFTGTSLYIAKQIEKNPVSIPQVIHEGKTEYSADSIGIVAPVYGHELPISSSWQASAK